MHKHIKYIAYTLYTFVLSLFHPLTMFSADCLFMTAHGKDMLENGLVRTTDIFTVHNFDFMYQKWAMCIETYLIYKNFGITGIKIASVLLLFICLVSLIFALEYLNPGKTAFNVITVLLTAMAISPSSAFRPHMIALVLLTIYLVIMEKFVKEPKRIHYLYLFLISIAVMWHHSTMWMLIFIFTLPYLCDIEILKRKLPYCEKDRTPDKKNLLKAIGVVFIGSLLQPNGIRQYEYMKICATAVSGSYRIHISELNPHPLSISNICIYVLFLIGVVIILINKKYRLRGVYMMCGGLILSLISFRFTPYSAVLVAFGAALNRQKAEIDLPEKFTKAVTAGLVVISIAWACGILWFSFNSQETWKVNAATSAIDAIEQNDTRAPNQIKVFASVADAGSYAIFKGYKTYFDCRAEIYDINLNHKKDVLSEYINLCRGKYKDNNTITYMQDFDKDYAFDYYVINKDEKKLTSSLDKCAELIYEDEYTRIYEASHD